MTPESLPPADYLLYVLGGKGRAMAVSTAAAWRLVERLADGPRSAAALAEEVGCPVAAMESVLRVCAGLGFFDCPRPGEFTPTERGRALGAEALGPMAAFVGQAEQWDPWARLRDARGDAPPFALAHGKGLYEWMAAHPAAAARYDAAIDAFTRHEAAALTGAFDFGGVRQVVDVGGGRGTLLAAVLAANAHLSGLLFDLPHVADAARAPLVARFGARVEVHGGDFFAAVPPGADAYLLKHVLHNWNDARAVELLRGAAAAMAPGGRVLVIENVLSPDARADMAAMLDLEMQVLLGGRVRRKPELRRLVADAGLAVDRFVPLTAGSWLLVAAGA
ncbi:MAG: methyltransferase [Planctomycetes bacterium]|nr:methyltransferase [Planctomycetota bacterium]